MLQFFACMPQLSDHTTFSVEMPGRRASSRRGPTPQTTEYAEAAVGCVPLVP